LESRLAYLAIKADGLFSELTLLILGKLHTFQGNASDEFSVSRREVREFFAELLDE